MQNDQEQNKERSSRIPTPEEVERYNRRLNDEEFITTQQQSGRLYLPDKPADTKEYKPTRRDYFTAAALTGLLGNAHIYGALDKMYSSSDIRIIIANSAANHADDIIKRLNETK